MKKHNFPELEEHKKVHQKFVEKLENIDLESIDEDQKQFSMELLDFVANWIEQHILGEDQKYKPFFADKNIN